MITEARRERKEKSRVPKALLKYWDAVATNACND
jgi:hypothetical protein